MYLICGEALYDVFVDPMDVDLRRRVSLTAKAGGSPYNVAIGLARLGCKVALATEIAGDTLGRHLEARLELEGVDRRFLRRTARATPLAMVDVDTYGTPRYAFYGLEHILFHPALETVTPQWPALTGVHIGSIPIVSPQSSPLLLELVSAAPAKHLVSFDPNVRLAIEPDAARWREAVERFRRLAHVIKVSEEDLVNLYGADTDCDSIAKTWLGGRCGLVVVTRGAKGASFHSRSAGSVRVPAVSVVIADTVGAGDSFQAAMLAWLAENRHASPTEVAALTAADITSLGQFAAQAAAATCRQKGPEFPYRRSLQPTR